MLDAMFTEEGESELLKANRQQLGSRSFILRQRPRFEFAMCLVARTALMAWMMSTESCAFYMMADGSPACGFESFAVVMAVVFGAKPVYRRRLPTVFLSVGHMGLTQNVFAFWWCLFLETGLGVAIFRWRLYAIKGVTTDRGVEKDICDCADVLPAFSLAIGGVRALRANGVLIA